MEPVIARIVSFAGHEDALRSAGLDTHAQERVIAGKRGLSLTELEGIASALNVGAYWLLTGEHDPHAVTFAGFGCSVDGELFSADAR